MIISDNKNKKIAEIKSNFESRIYFYNVASIFGYADTLLTNLLLLFNYPVGR